MRLTSMTIKNFKGIGEKGVTINFAPITMLFGPNNAGKSTVIQALHLAREVFCEHEPDFDRVAVYGEGMNLGAFRDYVHGHDINNVVRIKLDWDNVIIPSSSFLQQYNIDLSEIDDITYDINSMSIELEIGWEYKLEKSLLKEIHFYFNSHKFTSVKTKTLLNDKLILAETTPCSIKPFLNSGIWKTLHEKIYERDSFLTQDEIIPQLKESILYNFINKEEIEIVFPILDPLEDNYYKVEFKMNNRSTPQWGEPLKVEVITSNEKFYTDENDSFNENFNLCASELFTRLISTTGKQAQIFLNKLLYIGPIRKVPPRGIYKAEKTTHERWATGLAAWNVIAKANTAEMERLNKALSVLELNYSVVVESISNSAEDREELRKDAIEFIEQLKLTNAEEFTKESKEIFEAFSKAFNEGFAPIVRNAIQGIKNSQKKMHTFNRIVLKNNETSVTVEPQDMGLGVSQIIPFIVAATLAKRDAFIAVEQPELHIHPKLQVSLGDVVIQAALQSENKPIFLIETHSEHLLLRLLRRIRQTNEERAPEGLELTPEQVVINWIGAKDAQTYCLQLDIDEDGSFNTPWPEGFFGERGEELFG